jgi:ATP-dependent protease ClpP protease subunit
MTESGITPPGTVYVSFSAEINTYTTESLIVVMAQQVANGVPAVTLLFSTSGGTVTNGMNLYNMLRAMPFELTTHNVGNVDSIGNAVFLAGDRRYACRHSTFTFHGVGFDGRPDERLEEKFLRERLNSVLADQKRIAEIIEERTNLAATKIRALFRQAQTKDAEFAVSTGIVHAIRDIEIPEGSVIPLVFQR